MFPFQSLNNLIPKLIPKRPLSSAYADDIFDETRMSIGDHIEELRSRLIKALWGLCICLLAGFVLDYVGEFVGVPAIGMGRPMLKIITAPAEDQVRAFYQRRMEKKLNDMPANPNASREEVERIRKKLKDNDFDTSQLSGEEKAALLGAFQEVPVRIKTETLESMYVLQRKDAGSEAKYIEVSLLVQARDIHALNTTGQQLLETRQFMKTQSPQEAVMVYFMVSLLCGVVIACPWIFYQLWMFVSAGLYPHEKKLVHLYLPISIVLFLAGIVLCQFIVLPGAVKALIAFNDWIDLDPDLRMDEWLGFALMLPVVFGISFQTPLVMYFLCRIRLFTAHDYWSKWRYAVMILLVFAAVITPTPDVVTLMYLFIPMFGLYALGVLVCHLFPAPPLEDDTDDPDAQVAV